MRDTGSGIPPELRPKIFEPFVTSGKEHGTGLGLAIVREIVSGHGGAIDVESRVAGEEEGRPSGTESSAWMMCDRTPVTTHRLTNRPGLPPEVF